MENGLTNIMKKFSIDYSFIISDKTEDLKSDKIKEDIKVIYDNDPAAMPLTHSCR